MTDPTETARTPYSRTIRYGVTGAPEIPADVSTAPDITVVPTLVEIRYLAPRGEQPAFVDATVRGFWMRDGERVQPEKEILHHFKNGPDGWPDWLAEEARLHDPAAVSAAAPSTDHTTPSHRAGLRDEIAAAIWERQNPGRRWADCEYRWRADAEEDADAVLAVLYREWPWLRAEAEDAAPADRAAVLEEAADAVFALDYDDLVSEQDDENLGSMREAWDLGTIHAMKLLRRLAAEAPATNTQAECGCPHPVDEHSVYGCADGCGCEWMPKKKPMDPVRILGIADCPTPLSHNWGCGCPTDQLPLHAESGVDTPGCDCGHDGMGPKWHGKPCAWLATLTVPHPDDEPAVVEPAEAADTETVHGCPPDGSGLTPCCGRTPFELPRTDRISSEAPVTCTGAAEAQQDGAQT